VSIRGVLLLVCPSTLKGTGKLFPQKTFFIQEMLIRVLHVLNAQVARFIVGRPLRQKTYQINSFVLKLVFPQHDEKLLTVVCSRPRLSTTVPLTL
jgi:hypothetical protein